MAAPSQPPESKSSLPPTVLSALQQFTSQDAISPTTVHQFASSHEEAMSALRRIIDTASQASVSLNTHQSLPLSNPKLISLYRQQSSIAHTVQQSDQNVRHVIDSLRKRIGITFGEDIPTERTQIVEWFLKRLLEWGATAGMEVFNEPESNGRIIVTLGGKVLVIDAEFSIDRTDATRPVTDVASLKTAYAIPNSTSESSSGHSRSLDGFLATAIRAFLAEIQKDDEKRDSVEAARIGNMVSSHFSYLMKLDHLALAESEGGGRWFSFIDKMSLEIETVASKEANVIIQAERNASRAPLDVFLLRAHALPFPYLTTPSISFLTYLSPLAYLNLLRSASSTPITTPPANHLPLLDVPITHIRSALTQKVLPAGITLATLVLSPTPPPAYHQDSMNLSAIDARPSAQLVSDAARVESRYVFPVAREVAALHGQQFTWILDFTGSGAHPGVVVSQARMREIELVVNPFSGMHHIEPSIVSFGGGTGSWVDLLLNPQTPIPPERYSAIYTSPTGAHPPLHLRLTTPDEPGFVLETIPVQTLKEVWSVLEIVREQCWLNENLISCQWTPEGLNPSAPPPEPSDVNNMMVTDDELQAVLKGSIAPQSIPVNVNLPTQPAPEPPPDPLFADPPADLADAANAFNTPRRAPARIALTAPERPPISGLVEIGVMFDPARPRGVAVDIVGAMGVDVRVEALEEACRRGGLFGLPGRVWKKAHEML